jgi:hypothetical protein
MYKSLGTDQIPVRQIQAGCKILRSEIHRLVNTMWNKRDFFEQCKESVGVPINKRAIKLIVIINEAYHFYQLHMKRYQISFSQG